MVRTRSTSGEGMLCTGREWTDVSGEGTCVDRRLSCEGTCVDRRLSGEGTLCTGREWTDVHLVRELYAQDVCGQN